MNYRGVIIEESLKKKGILKKVKIIKTKIEKVVDKHKTPWLKKWTLHTVEVLEKEAEIIAQEISESLESEHPWYADFKNATTAFIIFRHKIFKIDRTNKKQHDEARNYGISLGIPSRQVDFRPKNK